MIIDFFTREILDEADIKPKPEIPDNNSDWYFWCSEEPWDKVNENGLFATMKEAIVDAENKIRNKADVLIFKTCWLGSGQDYHIVAVACCKINSNKQP